MQDNVNGLKEEANTRKREGDRPRIQQRTANENEMGIQL